MNKESLEFFDWIKLNIDELESDSPEWKGNFVSQCLPKNFSYYCKILHPVYRDQKIKDEHLLWSERRIGVDQKIRIGERLFYKDLVKKYNVQSTKEISTNTFSQIYGSLPRYIISPDEGNMEINLVEELVKILKPMTLKQKCYFHYYFLKTEDWYGDDLLFSGKLEDVLNLYDLNGLHGSPTYWWAEDQSWCLCTDYDLDFSLIGGTRELIDALLSNSELECFEVNIDTRIDYRADWKNVPTNKNK
ncbi:hypothetical protein HPK19_04290 [Arthrobacter citreus]|nr:hypothetical protein HPK19_04290 [Arthrobacter citreus]